MPLTSQSFPKGVQGELSGRSFIETRLHKLSFATPARAKSAFYELSALFDAGRIELDVSCAGGELVIGVRERKA